MVCDDESKGRLRLFSIIDWGKTRLKDCWTAILRSVSSLCLKWMLCGVQACLERGISSLQMRDFPFYHSKCHIYILYTGVFLLFFVVVISGHGCLVFLK